ncbi:MAG: ATP-binding protein [Bacteroidaceae bacterium]|nr:ATP-binding protein [Bacteroidaceae bacterium]
MKKAFVYGMSVEGENFTDRVKETKRLKLDFENGINVILVSPRRMGKSSIVKKVKSEINNPLIKVVYMDIYDCRSEYDFYNRFASALMKETVSKAELVVENIKRFLTRLTPKISFSSEPMSEISFSLGITPRNYQPEEILQLPEQIAKEQNVHIIVCIDEFQQIGEFTDSITIQKKLRSIWQHQRNVSYCLFGSKKHLMTNLFQNRKMPFYQFGEMMFLDKIATEDWVPFIQSRFASQGKEISEPLAKRICETVENNSSYVQQLAWNVLAETEHEVTEKDFTNGFEALLAQNSGLFEEQLQGLTTYQLNFIRAICNGIHSNFGSKAVLEEFNLGGKSNITRIKNTLRNREIIEIDKNKVFIEDPLFRIWFKRQYNNL